MEQFFAAVDLGTTTIECSLLSPDGSAAARYGFLNPQKRFGSDVISRMTYRMRHPEDDAPTTMVREGIRDALSKMLSWHRASYPAGLSRIVVTCNTAMGSILLGLPTDTLGQAPFTMPFFEEKEDDLYGAPMVVYPGTSAFLGSDACGGAWALPLGEDELLMDLGTNGEMILCHDGKLYGASAACGPAFENCTRSQGIYGSTTLAVLADMLRRGKISGDGRFPEEYAETGIPAGSGVAGGLRITPKILQDIQLAVGAIYATFSLLVSRAGMVIEDLRKIYLAGGFGFHLSLRDACTVGILPANLRDRVTVSGNTSLLAAEKLFAEGTEDYHRFRSGVTTLQFAGDKEYEKSFYEAMVLKQR